MSNNSNGDEVRADRLELLGRIVDTLADNEAHLDQVCTAAVTVSNGSGQKREREQAEDLHAAICATRDPELNRRWQKTLESWIGRQDGFPDLKITQWALEANDARRPATDLVVVDSSNGHPADGGGDVEEVLIG